MTKISAFERVCILTVDDLEKKILKVLGILRDIEEKELFSYVEKEIKQLFTYYKERVIFIKFKPEIIQEVL
ncbi:MAG: hypothetical protein ACFE94_13455 [Candidatus Hodarchaeota archaeon]